MSNPDDLLFMFQGLGTTDHDTLINQFKTIVNDSDTESARFFLEANIWNLQNAVASYFDAAGSGTINRQQQTTAEAEAIARDYQNAFYHSGSNHHPHLSRNRHGLGVTDEGDEEGNGEARDIEDQDGYYGDSSSLAADLPQMSIISELSDSTQVAYAGKPFVRQWRIKNSGVIPWPPNCQLVYVSGEHMERMPTEEDFIPPLQPGEECTITIVLTAPPVPGQYVATWSAAIIDEVAAAAAAAAKRRNQSQQAPPPLGVGGVIDFGIQGYPNSNNSNAMSDESNMNSINNNMNNNYNNNAMEEGSGQQEEQEQRSSEARLFGESMWLIVSVVSEAEQAMIDTLDFNVLKFGGEQK